MTISRRLGASLLAVGVLLLVLPLVACGEDPSGVQGIASAAGRSGTYPRSGLAVVAHKGSRDGPVVAETHTGEGGAFRLDLEPGTYTLVVLGDPAGSESVVVRSGQYSDVTLNDE